MALLMSSCSAGQTQDPVESPQVSTVVTPKPDETVPQPSAAQEQGERVKCRVNELYIRSSTNTSSKNNVLKTAGYEEEMWALDVSGKFTRVKMDDGTEGYAFSDYLVDANETLYGQTVTGKEQAKNYATGALLYESDGVTPVYVTNNMVDLRLYCPTVELDILFATDKNTFNEDVYGRVVPMLQKSVAENLQKAAVMFAEDGYRIKIYDAYRPVAVSRRLYSIVKISSLAADPDKSPSNHNRGAAVDMTLIDADGNELEMPTKVHCFDGTSARTGQAWTAEAKANSDYMTSIMIKAGFETIPSEWWHFAEPGARNKYIVNDIPFTQMTMVTADQIKGG